MGQIPNALGERLHQLDRDALTTLAEALCAQLTRHGGFHGGVRPENIVYDGPEAVTLGAPARTDTRDWGTQELEFMAPEGFWSGELAPSADVYSVGLLLYAGVHGGLLPFYPQNPAPNDRAEALRRRMNGETLPMPKSAGRPLAAIIQKATQFRAEDRYQTPEELAAALRRYREELHAAAPTAQEMFEKPEQELSDVERMMLGILAANAAVEPEAPEEEFPAPEEASEEAPAAPETPETEPAAEETPMPEAEAPVMEGPPAPEEAPEAEEEAAPAPEEESPAPEEEAAKADERRAAFVEEISASVAAQLGVADAAEKPAAETTADAHAPADPEKEAERVAAQVEKLGWIGQKQDGEKRRRNKGGIIAALCICALVLTALILRTLGLLGGREAEPVAAQTPIVSEEPTPAESAAVVPVETETPEPEPTPTPEPEPKVSSYEVVVSDASWETARAEAEAKGGHLAVIDSAEELQQITALAAEQGVRYVWIGLYRAESGELVWVTPTESGYFSWAPGEPSVNDTNGTPENYVLLSNQSGTWYYNDCSNDPALNYPGFYSGRLAYVIEYEE